MLGMAELIATAPEICISLSSLPAHKIRPPDCVIYSPVNKAAKGEKPSPEMGNCPGDTAGPGRRSRAGMRLPGLTSLVLELPWAGGTATTSTASAQVAKVHPAPQDPQKSTWERAEPALIFRAGADPSWLATAGRSCPFQACSLPPIHPSLLPLPRTFPG